MNNIKYSVIIPLYNKEAHIGRAIKSILAQTYRDFELIIVDDASTDNSLDVAGTFDDKRIKIITSEKDYPQGGSRARNVGINAATADWVCFLDADDEWKIDYLENINKLNRQFGNAVILSCGWIDYYSADMVVNNCYYQLKNKLGNHLYDRKTFLNDCINNCSPVWTSVATINKRVLLDVGGFPEGGYTRGEDIDTWFRVIMFGGVGAWSALIGAVYYRDSENMATKSVPPAIRNNYLVKSINNYLADEQDSGLCNLLAQYRKKIYKSTIKDFFDYWISHILIIVFWESRAKRILSYAVRQKRKWKRTLK